MKVLTKEEEDAHYAATVRGGIKGGLVGLAVGTGTAYLFHKRWPLFRNLTLPFKSFYVTSVGTFTAIIAADRSSRKFEFNRHGDISAYKDQTQMALERAKEVGSRWDKVKDWGREHRYPIVFTSWVASMAISLGLVSRNPYLTRPQKLVQARVYAQGLTLLVLVATAAFEIADKNSGESAADKDYMVVSVSDGKGGVVKKRVHQEHYAGEDLWRDIVEAEEKRMERMKEEEERVREAERDRARQLKEKRS